MKSEKELWPACQLSCFCFVAGGSREAILREGQGGLLFFVCTSFFARFRRTPGFARSWPRSGGGRLRTRSGQADHGPLHLENIQLWALMILFPDRLWSRPASAPRPYRFVVGLRNRSLRLTGGAGSKAEGRAPGEGCSCHDTVFWHVIHGLPQGKSSSGPA